MDMLVSLRVIWGRCIVAVVVESLLTTSCGVKYRELSWGRRWAKFICRKWYQGTPTMNSQTQCLVYTGTILYGREEYLGESEVTLDGRIRTHLQSALDPNKNHNAGIDRIQESV